MAYDNLLGRSRSYRQHNMETGEMLPEEKAKGKPLVHFYWLLRTPTAVNQPLWTGSHASRLLDYVDTDHCGQQIPLEDRQRIYLWIDANVPYYGTYAHARPDASGRRDRCADPATGRESPWFANDLGLPAACASHATDLFPIPTITGQSGTVASPGSTSPTPSSARRSQPIWPRTLADEASTAAPTASPHCCSAPRPAPDYQVMLKAIETGRLHHA